MQGRTLTSQQVNWTDEFRLKFVIAGAELIAWGVLCLTRNLNSVFSWMGKRLRVACFFFLHPYFPIIDVFPPLLERESSNFSPPRVPEPTLSDFGTLYRPWNWHPLNQTKEFTRPWPRTRTSPEIKSANILSGIDFHATHRLSAHKKSGIVNGVCLATSHAPTLSQIS